MRDETSMGGGLRELPLTRWTLIRQARASSETERRQALEHLACAYWKPLYCFLRASGSGNEEAKDLVQGFFAAMLERDLLERFDARRGRFRTFLLSCLRNHARDQRDRLDTKIRGGDWTRLPLDATGEEAFDDVRTRGLDPEAAYHRSWAVAKLERAVAQVRAHLEDRKQSAESEILEGFLAADNVARPGYAALSARSGWSEDAVRHALERLKAALKDALLEEIRPESPASEAQEELAFLVSCLGG